MITGAARSRTERAHTLSEARRRGASRPERMDDLCLAGVAAVGDALDAARLAPGDVAAMRHAIYAGTALGSLESDHAFYTGLLEGNGLLSNPRLFAYTLPNVVLGEVAITYGLTGENLCLDAGRVSGLAAIAEAARAIDEDRRDIAIVLALDVVGPGARRLFEALGTEPRPCAAAFTLEREDLCRSRGATPLARVARVEHAFDPDPTVDAPFPDPDPLGCAGIDELLALIDARRDGVVSALCRSGHHAAVRLEAP